MKTENKSEHKCSNCGVKLTQYEISDNLFAGVIIGDYVCYSCQEFEEKTDDDDELFGYPDHDNLEY